MRSRLFLALAASVSAVCSQASADAIGVSLQDEHISRNRRYTCGYVNGGWEGGRVERGLFYSYLSRMVDLQHQYNLTSNARQRRRLVRQIIDLNKRRVIANRNLCARLDAPRLVTSLAQLPSPSTLVRAATSTQSVHTRAASGTPPTLSQLAEGDVTEVFWRPGVIEALVSGTPSPIQCSEMFGAPVDGRSGGMSACFMAQSVGHSFEPIVRSGRSMCFMKNAPTRANQAAGAVSIVGGRLPNNDVTKLFLPPSGNISRLVHVAIGGQIPGDDAPTERIYIRVYSQGENAASNRQYGFLLYHCPAGDGNATGFERVSIGNDGLYSVETQGIEASGSHDGLITGYLTAAPDGTVVFDTARNRSAVISSVAGTGELFKADLLITPNNLVYTKHYDVTHESTRKGYSIAQFTGTSIQELGFLQGAFKDSVVFTGEAPQIHTNGTEYRSGYYASAPDNSLTSELDGVDPASDPFFAVPPAVFFNSGEYSCAANPDVAVTVDFSNPTLLASVMSCAEDDLSGMNFCNNDTLRQAQEGWFNACPLPPGPH